MSQVTQALLPLKIGNGSFSCNSQITKTNLIKIHFLKHILVPGQINYTQLSTISIHKISWQTKHTLKKKKLVLSYSKINTRDGAKGSSHLFDFQNVRHCSSKDSPDTHLSLCNVNKDGHLRHPVIIQPLLYITSRL